jgi:hypothetical protein
MTADRKVTNLLEIAESVAEITEPILLNMVETEALT